MTAADVVFLQRTAGNAATTRIIAAGGRAGSLGGGPVIQRRAVSAEERQAFLKAYPVAAQLVHGIDAAAPPGTVLDALVRNFDACGFTYTMAKVNERAFLTGTKSGDCGTLSNAFKVIATEYFGIDGVDTAAKRTSYMVPRGGRVMDVNASTGNVDRGAHWVFTSHTWVTGPDRTRDILFRGAAVDQSGWVDRGGVGKDAGIEYEDFGDVRVYEYLTVGPLATRYTTDRATALAGKAENERLVAEQFAETQRQTKAAKARTEAGKKSRCFLTSACVHAMGLPDHCAELATLRRFRDGYMARMPEGPGMVADYYRIAPRIVDAIDVSPRADDVYRALYGDVRRAVALVESGRHPEALSCYRGMVGGLAGCWL